MQLIINDTILIDGEFKGQKALSVWKYNPNYFKELQKQKLAKIYIFPEYIRNLGDIDKVQKDNQANWKAEKPYHTTWIFKYWQKMAAKMRSYEKLKQKSLF